MRQLPMQRTAQIRAKRLQSHAAISSGALASGLTIFLTSYMSGIAALWPGHWAIGLSFVFCSPFFALFRSAYSHSLAATSFHQLMLVSSVCMYVLQAAHASSSPGDASPSASR